MAILLAACLFLTLLAGCGGQNAADTETAENILEDIPEDEGIWLCLDAYPYADAVLSITDAEETYETGSMDIWAAPDMTVGDVLTVKGITAVEPSFEGNTFEGWLEDGQALNDVMGVDGWASLVSIEKEGAAFTGWTLYQADTLYWAAEPSGDEGTESFLTDPDWDEGKYTVLVNPVVVRELSPTEELCGITCAGENYLAVANWQ